jgi:hypothetical protein
MRRKLVVGNWKMHGSRPANAELLAGIARGAALRLRRGGVRAVPVPVRDRRHAGRQRRALGRAGLLGARAGRLHRRGVGRHAGRVRLPLRHRRPQRAPRLPRRERPAGGREGARPRWPRASRPSSASARPWPSAKPARPRRGQAPAVGRDPPRWRIAPARWWWPTSPCGPSAPAAPPRPNRRRPCTRCCARSCRRPPAMADACDPLRRQREGRQRGHAVCATRHRRRPDRRRLAEGGRLHRHLPRRGLNRVRPNFSWRNEIMQIWMTLCWRCSCCRRWR